MKNKIILTGTVILAVITGGCDNSHKERSVNQTYFPTNRWQVVGQGTNGQVVVEAKENKLVHRLQVVTAEAVVPLTNGQSVRVELTVSGDFYGRFKLIGSKAYPSMD